MRNEGTPDIFLCSEKSRWAALRLAHTTGFDELRFAPPILQIYRSFHGFG